jgi:hypothetical protein
MKPNLKWTAVAVGCAAISAAAFVGGRAWAGGIPAAGALNYSGLLQDSTGAPLSGTQYVEVKFWNDATAGAAVNLLCDTGTPTGIGLVNGRFSIPLPDKCTTQVGSNAGVWAEVIVGPTANAAASLGRAKIGAVPFAVEANHAVSADSAAAASTAVGTLAAQVAQLQSQSHPVSAFHAYLTVATSVASAGTPTVPFDTVEYDLASEYTIATGTFSPKQTGYYLLECSFFFSSTASGEWAALIYRNGVQVGVGDVSGVAYPGVGPLSSVMVKLAAGDSVKCLPYQGSGMLQPLYLGLPGRNSFSAARLY